MLDKLYITPKQWLHILRWTLYSLVVLLAMMLQTVVQGNPPLLGVRLDLVPAAIVCVCMREGPERGGLFALLSSLIWCLSGADHGSISIAVLTVIPVLSGLLCRTVLVNRFVPCLLTTLIALFLEQGTVFLLSYFLDGMAGFLFYTKLLPCVFLSLLSQPVIYLLVKRIEKIGDAYESI